MAKQEFLNIDFTFDLEKYPEDIKNIDPEVRNLVIALNDMGISTGASCQGHMDENKQKYPWIHTGADYGIGKRGAAFGQLYSILKKFRSEEGVNWKFSLNEILPSKKSIDKFSLDQLQKSANELADLIQSSILDS